MESMVLQKADDEVWFAVVSPRVAVKSGQLYHVPGHMGLFVDMQSYSFYYPCSKSRV